MYRCQMETLYHVMGPSVAKRSNYVHIRDMWKCSAYESTGQSSCELCEVQFSGMWGL